VGGLVEAGAGSASAVSEDGPPALIHRRDQRAGRIRIHGDVGGAGVFVHEEHVAPGLPAVGGLVDAALFRRTPEVAAGGDVESVRIGGGDDDAPDVHRGL